MATKNRFAISTVFDFDDRPFNKGVDSVTVKTEKLANNSKHQYYKMFREANTAAKKTEKSYTDMFRGIAGAAGKFKGHMGGIFAGISGSAGLGALLTGMTAQDVLEVKYKAEAVGLTSPELKEFSLIAKQADLGIDNVADLFEEMHNKLGMAKKGIYEAGLKDYGQAVGLDQRGLSELLKQDASEQFETIISELDKLDLQAAIGIGDSLFGGEFNRFYRSYRTHYKDLNAARQAWKSINNLTDEGRKGNEEYAASLNVIATSLTTALQDVSGKIGHELAPYVDSFNVAFNEIYRNSDQWFDDMLSNLDFQLEDSTKNIAKWGAGIVGVLGGIFASYKVGGKLLGGSKKVLQKVGIVAPDVQKVFVVNMPSSGLDLGGNSSGSSGGKGSKPSSQGRGRGGGLKTRGATKALFKGALLEYGLSVFNGATALYGTTLIPDFSPIKWGRADERNDSASFFGMTSGKEHRPGIDQFNIPKKVGLLDVYDDAVNFVDYFKSHFGGSEASNKALSSEQKNSHVVDDFQRAKDILNINSPTVSVVPLITPDYRESSVRPDAELLTKVHRSLERLVDLQEQNMNSNSATTSVGLDHVSVIPTAGFNY
ncbi:hypothetical protein P3521_03780 [Vibrio parahaemolyticus]|nr:hypothetical protein [Vibrio parahaemolyticus]MDF4668722.1 hypothetical protein [Vibrio parahaemolyticus]HAV1412729.1 hypothetical protein [Vibrio parahaemolyticus]HAV2004811.1 hypothetical protein [Vibrio parahaemolyticus]